MSEVAAELVLDGQVHFLAVQVCPYGAGTFLRCLLSLAREPDEATVEQIDAAQLILQGRIEKHDRTVLLLSLATVALEQELVTPPRPVRVRPPASRGRTSRWGHRRPTIGCSAV